MSERSGDIFQRLEQEVRTHKTPLLVDAFLPPLEELPATVIPPPEPTFEGIAEERGCLQSGRGDDPAEKPAPRRRRAAKESEPPKTLREEIAEFMTRDGAALAPDLDP
jgi:hypothetical protein